MLVPVPNPRAVVTADTLRSRGDDRKNLRLKEYTTLQVLNVAH